MSVVRVFAALLLSGLLTACVAVAPGSKPVAADFDILGRVLISGEGRAFSSGLRWRHDAAGDELWLMSPVGQTLAHIVADDAGAVLTTPDQLEYRDRSVENLTRRALGWPLPLGGLRHWVQAAPIPGENPAISNRDGTGRLLLLEQAGWSIRYSYPEVSQAALPRRLDLSRSDQQIRLLIDSWRSGDGP